MNEILLTVLSVGAVLMCALVALQMKWYHVPVWKSTVVSVAMILTGLVGADLWFYLENGYREGRSFYGAIFLCPLTFFFVAKLLRVRYLHMLDFCASAGCLILAVLKIQCIAEGCCQGIILYVNESYMYVRFPSQIIEFVCALVLTAMLLILSHNEKYRGKIYPITLILYGSTRFVLNLFRDDWGRAEQMNLPVPIGNIWSLMAVLAGCIWLIAARRKKQTVS